VALLIPPPVSVEIDALRRAVGIDDVTRIPPHVTLVPPVNVREDEIGAALDVLRGAASSSHVLRLELGPVTSFAPVSPTIHLAVGGELDALRRLRDAVFTPPLRRTLTHDWVPHVTLVEESAHIDAAVQALAGYRTEVVLDRVHLLEERRRDDGTREWQRRADAPLGRRPAVIGRGGLELELVTSGVLAPDASAWLVDRWDDFEVERFDRVLPSVIPVAVVARREGRIVAAADGEVRPTTAEAYLAHLIVANDVRGEGVGAHVLAAFGSAAAEHGATYVTLRTEADGRSRPFYERLGFTEWYRMPQWRAGRDFVQMRRGL
jgi:2'-5' RNA ligase/GNAT superfamily N-acetyltransferase